MFADNFTKYADNFPQLSKLPTNMASGWIVGSSGKVFFARLIATYKVNLKNK